MSNGRLVEALDREGFVALRGAFDASVIAKSEIDDVMRFVLTSPFPPALVEVLDGLIGEPWYVRTRKVVIAEPVADSASNRPLSLTWHRDYTTGAHLLILCVPTSVENGATRILVGSHPDALLDMQRAVAFATGEPGDCYVMRPNMWHTRGPNLTDQLRYLGVAFIEKMAEAEDLFERFHEPSSQAALYAHG